MPVKTIVAIGGGELRELKTLAIDEEIVRLSGRRRPRALFLPTASGDSKGYWEAFRALYGDRLGGRPEVLWTFKDRPGEAEIVEKILGSDLIYVGGGNTLRMMRIWRKLGIDKLLLQAYGRGVVLSGLSAGSICWFKWGHSDSRKFTAGDGSWEYIRVRGLGIIPAAHCPHYDSQERRLGFAKMIGKHGGVGIALDGQGALVCQDDSYRVLSVQAGDGAYRLRKRKGEVITEVITGPGSVGDLCLRSM